jgi:uncharacterized peroxidase-related enzyme
MARLQPIPTEQAGEAKPLLEAVQSALGITPNMASVMANSPVVLKGWAELNGTLGKGRLGGKLREQIALTVAEANQCDYCLSAHTAIGAQLGVDAEELEHSRYGESSDPRTAAALRFAKAVNEGRGEVDDADVAAVRAAGFDDAEIAEIVANVVLNVYTNYFNKVAQTEIDFPRISAGVAVRAAA